MSVEALVTAEKRDSRLDQAVYFTSATCMFARQLESVQDEKC